MLQLSYRIDGNPLPRVDGILDSVCKIKFFSIFDFNSAIHQIVADRDTVPLDVFGTPTQLFEFLRIPQRANAWPSLLAKVINKIFHGVDRVPAYLGVVRFENRYIISGTCWPSSSDSAGTTT